jgi:hypothetical protein
MLRVRSSVQEKPKPPHAAGRKGMSNFDSDAVLKQVEDHLCELAATPDRCSFFLALAQSLIDLSGRYPNTGE